MRFAALGRTQWLYDSIRAVVAEGHQIVLIGTSPAAPEYTITENDFANLADELGCPFFCDQAINHPMNIQMIGDSGADVAISVNWVTIIGQKIISQFKHGILNAHAGNLPRYRGNAVPNWAILNGENNIVLTLHKMVADLDAGPILLQRTLPLTPSIYIADIYSFLSKNIPQMFVEVIEKLSAGTLCSMPQPDDPERSIRCFPRLPRDGEIDWRQSAEYLSRLVRASAEPFSGAYTFLGEEKLIIWRAYPDLLPYPYLGTPGQVAERRKKSGEVIVLTGDGVLVLQEVETSSAGRKRANDVITSIRVRLGMDLTAEINRLRNRVLELDRLIQEGNALKR